MKGSNSGSAVTKLLADPLVTSQLPVFQSYRVTVQVCRQAFAFEPGKLFSPSPICASYHHKRRRELAVSPGVQFESLDPFASHVAAIPAFLDWNIVAHRFVNRAFVQSVPDVSLGRRTTGSKRLPFLAAQMTRNNSILDLTLPS